MIEEPFNADKVIGMTEAEAKEYIQQHGNGLQYRTVTKEKISREQLTNTLNCIIEDDFIVDYFVT